MTTGAWARHHPTDLTANRIRADLARVGRSADDMVILQASMNVITALRGLLPPRYYLTLNGDLQWGTHGEPATPPDQVYAMLNDVYASFDLRKFIREAKREVTP
jgi:hypothetical protein